MASPDSSTTESMGPTRRFARARVTPGRAGISAAAVLLVLGAALSLVVGQQAYSSVRNHRAVVTGIMDDYAFTAATYFERDARNELSNLNEHLFHPLHDVGPNQTRRSPPDLGSILHDPASDPETCSFGDVGALGTAYLFSVSATGERQVGPDMAGAPAGVVREEVLAHMRAAERMRRTEGLMLLSAAAPTFLFYSVQRVQLDTMVAVLPIPTADLKQLFSGVLARSTLLPATLTNGLPADSLLAVALTDADGRVFFGATPEAAPTGKAETELAANAGLGVTVGVGMRPRAADLLILGGAPGQRLPFLLGVILLSLTLIVVGVRQMRREQALASERARFVANVSHELRTPIALQRIFIDMLLTGRVDAEKDRRWSLESLDRETRRLGQLVENVLQFSRLERGAFDFRRESVELGAELVHIAERFRPLLAAEGRIELEAQAGLWVQVDREALGHAVMNLLENARRYGPVGQTISLRAFEHDGMAVLLVDDEGPGIPAASRRSVWNAFRRGEGADVAAKGGSGIGLAIVREIVEFHGGEASIEDAPGRGARIRIQIPLTSATEQGARRSTVGTVLVADGPGESVAHG